MSVAVLIGVHDGLVIAADSASTLTISTAPNQLAGIANVYDNANKIFNLYKGLPIGCVTFGSGSIGNSSIGTLIKDFRSELMDNSDGRGGLKPQNYKMEDICKKLADFLQTKCEQQPSPARDAANIGLLLAGYSSGESLGETWRVEIEKGRAKSPQREIPPDQAGVSWGGMGEAIHRILLGFSPQLFQVLADVSGGNGNPSSTAKELNDQLNQLLIAKLQANLVFAPMPIQDAIDLGKFLVHSAIMFSRFLPGHQMVGGPIEIAAITKHEGFKWIERKHYFDQTLNKEAVHVIVD
jgi:hypothetical protein